MQYHISIQLKVSLPRVSRITFKNIPLSAIDGIEANYHNDLQVFDCLDEHTKQFNLITKTSGATLIQSVDRPYDFLRTTINGSVELTPYSLANVRAFEWYPATKAVMPMSQIMQATLLKCSSSNHFLHNFREVG